MATPKLRFKEFDGDWTSKQLGKIIGISSASRVFKEQWQDSGVPFFRTSDVVSIFKNKENEKAYISLELFEELAKKSGKIKQGDLLVTGGGSIGIPYLVPNDQPLYFKDADLLWMKSSGIVEGSFLYNFFISPKFREYLKSISHTGTISHFTIEQAKATPFGFPSKEEQTKIASFLSNVDEKISQLTQKHELLSQYKQGMMQKLFSQQIRFKADDGSKFGKWVNKKIIEIADYVDFRGKTPKKVDNGILLVTAKNIRFGYIDYEVSREYIGSDDFEEVMRRGCAKIGDVLITTEAPLGNVASVDREDIALAQRVIKYRGKEGILNNAFLKQKFLSEDFQALIASKATGGTVQGIKGSTLHNLEIYIPQDIEEQTKIANFLSSIDQKIEVVAQQIEQAKQWKKGLLQQMFV